MDPNDSDVLYAAGIGLYKTVDGGDSWTALHEDFPTVNDGMTQGIYAIAMHPEDSDVLFIEVSGIRKTVDGGGSWELLELPEPAFVTFIEISPANPDVIFAGTQSGILYRSTDGGASWSNSVAGVSASRSSELAFRADKPGWVYYVTDRLGLFLSKDYGQTWEILGGDFVPISPTIGLHPQNPDWMIVGANNRQVSASTDGGLTWERTNGRDLTTTSNNWVRQVAFDPVEPHYAYLPVNRGLYVNRDPFSIVQGSRAERPAALFGDMITDEDTPHVFELFATDAERDSLTFSVIDSPNHGRLEFVGPRAMDQEATNVETESWEASLVNSYIPDDDFAGQDSLLFTVNDGTLASEPATVLITVVPVNDKPFLSGFSDQRIQEDAGSQEVTFESAPGGGVDEMGKRSVPMQRGAWRCVGRVYRVTELAYGRSEGAGWL